MKLIQKKVMLTCKECSFESARKSVIKAHIKIHLTVPKGKVKKYSKKDIF